MQPNTFQFETEDLSLQRKMNDIIDWGLMLAVAAVIGMGLISIYSATFETSASTVFANQVIYAMVGIASAITMFFLPERWISNLAYPA